MTVKTPTQIRPHRFHLKPVARHILDQFERQRHVQPLSQAELKALNATLVRDWYQVMADDPVQGPDKLAEFRNSLFEADGTTEVDLIAADAARMIEATGADATPETVSALAANYINTIDAAQVLWDKGLQAPNAPRINRGRIARVVDAENGSLLSLAEMYLEERQRDAKAGPTPKTIYQARSTLRLFSDFVGDKPLAEVTRQDASAFLATLATLHRNYGRRPGAASLPLKTLLSRFKENDGVGLSNRTLNRHLSALLAFYKWARKNAIVDGENPFSDLSRPKGKQSEIGWLPYTIDELNALFKGASFDVEPAKRDVPSCIFWITAIALYTGMRLNEICSLSKEDIKKEKGIPYFDIAAAKTEAGIRKVPMHTSLIELGLQEFVVNAKDDLFADINFGGPNQTRAHYVTRRFTALRRSRGVTRDRVCFHSLRKNFVKELERAGIQSDRASLVIGHGGMRSFTFGVYNPDSVDMEALSDVVESVKYESLEF